MSCKINGILPIVVLILMSCSAKSPVTELTEKVNYSAESSNKLISTNYPSPNKYIAKLLTPYRSLGRLLPLMTDPERYAMNIISWQMEHGGFGVHEGDFYQRVWDGKTQRSVWVSKGIELGNFNDDTTVAEIRFLAKAYQNITDPDKKHAIKNAVDRALTFVFKAQYETGGWAQVYPRRENRVYSNYVTLNDHAMIRVMVLLADIESGIAPFDSDIVAPRIKEKIPESLVMGVDYLLEAQIRSQGRLTIWGAQSDPYSYEPKPARNYEFASKATRESVGVLAFLMNWPFQTEEVKTAVSAGVTWFENNKIEDLKYHKGEFFSKPGAELWYRYYDVERDVYFFGDRDGVKKYDLAKVSEERRKGYGWAGSWGTQLLKVASRHWQN